MLGRGGENWNEAAPGSTVDAADVARFDRLGEDWWDTRGPMRMLHRLNPIRVEYVRDLALRYLRGRADIRKGRPLEGLTILDIGCGGGILCEPLARLGGQVTGIDPAPRNIDVARRHAERHGLEIDYRVATAEELVADGATFDLVLAMEVVEHVTDAEAFLATACRLVAPNGLFVGSTLNRTLRSFALAIVGAEYVLNWLPKGTHRWEQFVTPHEFAAMVAAVGFRAFDRTGIVFDPLDGWRKSRDTGVNYMIAARRRPSPG